MSWINCLIAMRIEHQMILPACMVNRIREEFPKPNGTYIGIKNSKKIADLT